MSQPNDARATLRRTAHSKRKRNPQFVVQITNHALAANTRRNRAAFRMPGNALENLGRRNRTIASSFNRLCPGHHYLQEINQN